MMYYIFHALNMGNCPMCCLAMHFYNLTNLEMVALELEQETLNQQERDGYLWLLYCFIITTVSRFFIYVP
jgi:hypothetical protein